MAAGMRTRLSSLRSRHVLLHFICWAVVVFGQPPHPTPQPDAASYVQPQWDRSAGPEASAVHALLESAARLHQQGELDLAVQEFKKAIQHDPKNGEAYASLSKCLSDQDKHELAAKAMAKATRIHNDMLASWSLF